LRTALVEADAIADHVRASLAANPGLAALGVEILGFSILALRPVPDTARALEAEARERLLREADDAVYGRRSNAVDQERRIKESELAGQIVFEERRRELVAVEAQNSRTRADALAYATEKQLEPIRTLDPRSLQVLAAGSADPRPLVAMAFQEIAQNAAKVGTLNITPELLESLLRPTARARGKREGQ
jgi:hypothetical protein